MEAMKTTAKCYLMLDGHCRLTSAQEIENMVDDGFIEILNTTNIPQYLPTVGWFRIITTYARTRK